MTAPWFTVLAAGPCYNLGPLGFALFFLISGFVIPISLDRQSAFGFLVARGFRIYPTYFAVLAIEIAVLVAGALYWHRPLSFGHKQLVANALLVRYR